jgi:hypothetical protein
MLSGFSASAKLQQNSKALSIPRPASQRCACATEIILVVRIFFTRLATMYCKSLFQAANFFTGKISSNSGRGGLRSITVPPLIFSLD